MVNLRQHKEVDGIQGSCRNFNPDRNRVVGYKQVKGVKRPLGGWFQRKPRKYNTESFSVLTQSMKDNVGMVGSTYNSLPQATAVYPCREDFFLLPMGSLTFLGWFAPQGKLILVERFSM